MIPFANFCIARGFSVRGVRQHSAVPGPESVGLALAVRLTVPINRSYSPPIAGSVGQSLVNRSLISGQRLGFAWEVDPLWRPK